MKFCQESGDEGSCQGALHPRRFDRAEMPETQHSAGQEIHHGASSAADPSQRHRVGLLGFFRFNFVRQGLCFHRNLVHEKIILVVTNVINRFLVRQGLCFHKNSVHERIILIVTKLKNSY